MGCAHFRKLASWLLCAAVLAALAQPDAGAADVLTAHAVAMRIDGEINTQLDARKITASDLADDAEFLRRAYLDIHGVIPGLDRTVAFLEAKQPDKRALLIDELLASPRYGFRFADIWDGLLVRPKPGDDLRRYSRVGLNKWLEEGFNRNRPWNEMVYDLITASGHRDENPPVTYLSNGGLKQVLHAGDAAGSVSRLFLGVQLQCAECHDHPFADWKKADFWALAGFFSKTQRIAYWELTEAGKPNKIPKLPEHALKIPPKFLDGVSPVLDADGPYRPVLARWLTAPENPYFARATVNRVWSQFFGRGLVNPIDDLRPDNPATHPELLDFLTEQFVASGFDLKFLVRAIANSQVYQRSSRPTAENKDDQERYSHMTIKVLNGEQLYDSLVAILGEPTVVQKGAKIRGSRPLFADYYNPEEVDADPIAYSRGIPQMLRSLNANEFRANTQAAIDQLFEQCSSPGSRIESLYLQVLSRQPSAAERERMRAFLGQRENDPSAYRQVLWALLNTSEFSVNH